MISLERATVADCERVVPLLLSGFPNSKLGEAAWRKLFYYPWSAEDDTRGFLLLEEGRVVGFFGLIISSREVDGRVEKIGNLTTWVTLPEYRNHSLRLFDAATSLSGTTLTCYTANTSTFPFYLRGGFQDLDREVAVLYPVPSLRAWGSWFRFRAISNRDRIRARLPAPEQKISDDHRDPAFLHYLIQGARGDCYVIFTRIIGRRFALAKVHYVSNLALFRDELDRIRLGIGLAARAWFVLTPARFLGGIKPRWSKMSNVHRQFFYSETLRAEQIDNLYSEITLLGL